MAYSVSLLKGSREIDIQNTPVGKLSLSAGGPERCFVLASWVVWVVHLVIEMLFPFQASSCTEYKDMEKSKGESRSKRDKKETTTGYFDTFRFHQLGMAPSEEFGGKGGRGEWLVNSTLPA